MNNSTNHEESNKFINHIFMQTPVAIMILLGTEYEVALANELYLELIDRKEDIIGNPLFDVLPELKTQGIKELLDKVYQTGISYHGFELEVQLHRRNQLQKGYFNFTYTVKRNQKEEIIGVIVVATEVTEQVVTRKVMENQARMVYNLLMTSPSFVCTLIGPTHIFDIVNDNYQHLFGHRILKGKPVFEAIPELIGQDFDKILDKVYRTGESYTGLEVPVNISRDQNLPLETGFFNFGYQAMYDENNQVNGILVSGYEVTEQTIAKNKILNEEKIRTNELEKHNTERENDLVQLNIELQHKNQALELANDKISADYYARSLIEASLDPIITINQEGKIMDLNEAFATATGGHRDSLIGTDFVNYFTEPEKARKGYLEVFEKGFLPNLPLTIIDGELTDVLFNGSIYRNKEGNVQGAVVVARDISELKEKEKELMEAKVFAELATTLAQEAKIKAEVASGIANDAVKSKQQFLSNMSHEIRTPMNAIIGFTKVLMRSEIDEKQMGHLMAIKQSGDSLIILINDILDLAKVDSGKMVFEKKPFVIVTSIRAMMHLFETKIQEKNLSLVNNIDPRIPRVLKGDSLRLHQIILNLLSNAVKFTNNGKISVDIALISQDEKSVTLQFHIADTGIGIPAEHLSGIFENFQQASTETSRLYGGTGLGLAIVKKLVESQGGSIKVESKVNEGSIFSFVLGFEKTNEEAELVADEFILKAENIKLRILVVEDIPLNQLLMKTLIDDFGFEKDIVGNGLLAIKMMEQNTYDLILMDLQMPEMNGFEATEYIRKTLKSEIPIIALTADVTTVDLAKCKAVGMNDYIAKPVDEKVLYNKILSLTVKSKSAEITKANKLTASQIEVRSKCIDLSFLHHRTKSDPALMMEIMSLYMDQTPNLVFSIKTSFENKDWKTLYSAIHKMIPSFAIVGLNNEFEEMAKEIQEYAKTQTNKGNIEEKISKLESICLQACEELMIEFNGLKAQKLIKD